MKYPKPHFEEGDLFISLDTDILNFKKNTKQYKRYRRRHAVAGCIFAACLYEILLDIIHNNVTFVLPCNGYADISMSTCEGELFKEWYKAGWFKDLDYVKSGMLGHLLQYSYARGSHLIKSYIQVDDKLNNLIKDYTEQGKQYN